MKNRVVEFNPQWHDVSEDRLLGVGHLYLDHMDGRFTNQVKHTFEVSLDRYLVPQHKYYESDSELSDKCYGFLTLTFDDEPKDTSSVVGHVPLIYGNEGPPLRRLMVCKDRFVAYAAPVSFRTCEQLFMGADMHSWQDLVEDD